MLLEAMLGTPVTVDYETVGCVTMTVTLIIVGHETPRFVKHCLWRRQEPLATKGHAPWNHACDAKNR